MWRFSRLGIVSVDGYVRVITWEELSICGLNLYLLSYRLELTHDSGPNWIHGTFGNPIVPLSELAHSTLNSFEHSCPVFDSNGDLLDQKEADELQDLLWQVIEQATEYSKAQKASIPAEKSLYDYGVEKAEELFGGGLSEVVRPDLTRAESGRIRWKGQEQRKALWLDMVHMFVPQYETEVT